MGTDDGKGTYPDYNSHEESVGNDQSRASSSGSLNKLKTRKSARFNIPEDQTTTSNNYGGRSMEADWSGSNIRYNSNNSNDNQEMVEITMNVHEDDSVSVHRVKAVGSEEDPKSSLLARTSEELQRITSFNRRCHSRFDQNNSAAANALEGLKFISETAENPIMKRKKNSNKDSDDPTGWEGMEKKFDGLSTGGLLEGSKFGECIGMTNKGSEGFALALFNALARRRNISVGRSISKDQFLEFWMDISDKDFVSRLQIFFDMENLHNANFSCPRNTSGDNLQQRNFRVAWVEKDDDNGRIPRYEDRRITRAQLIEILSLSASANNLSIQKQATVYADLIIKELDPDGLGYIMIENLEMLLSQAQPVRGQSQILSQALSKELAAIATEETNPIRNWYQDNKYFVVDNWQRVWVLCLWLGIMLSLFVYKFVQYRNRAVYNVMGYCVCTAKGAAETLKFNMALILLPVCRNTITWLRNRTNLGVCLVPFDDNINFHKVIAVGIVVGVVLHAGAHLTCDFPRLLHASQEEYEPMKPFFGDDQPQSYWWFIKGVEGSTGIVMVVLMAIAFTLATTWFRRGKIKFPEPSKKKSSDQPSLEKKSSKPSKKTLSEILRKRLSPGFNMFWYTHHLFIIVYTLLVVHGIKLYLSHEWYKKTTWMYLAIPVVLYSCERLVRALRSSIKPVKILKAAVYPGKLLALQMSKPQGFKYRSGQYMFVKCSTVSPFEWHPFSITSAPGDDYLSVHIKPQGDWTRDINDVFSKVRQPSTNRSTGLPGADFNGGGSNPNFPRVSIDGPYGAPSQDYKKYEVVLLVGSGIGATPMISIVKDIINNTNAVEDEDAMEAGRSSTTANKNNKTKSGFKTQKAYFYWMTPDQGSFEWFKEVLNEVAAMDQNEVIELHNHHTRIYQADDARSTLLTLVQSLNHAKYGDDFISGTHVNCHFARPNWYKVYKRIALNHKDSRVGVFYCGSAAAVEELRDTARYFSHKTSTKFDFHKENF